MITVENYNYCTDEPYIEDVGAPENRPLWAQKGRVEGRRWGGLRPLEVDRVLSICTPKDDNLIVIKAAGTVESGRRAGFKDLYLSEVWINGRLVGTYTY